MFRPGGVAAPDGKHVFITTGRGKNVAIIDSATQQVLAAIEVGARPWGVAVSGDGKTIHRERAVQRRVDRGRREPYGEGHGQSRRSTLGRSSTVGPANW